MSSSKPNADALVADLGGTHVRFALVDIGASEPLVDGSMRSYPVAHFPKFADALRRYLDETGSHPRSAVIAAAGLRVDDEVRLTNLPWVISRAGLERDLGFEHVSLINDFAAMALSVPLLKPDDVRVVGAAKSVPFDIAKTQTFAFVGPGTGLGVGALIVRDGAMHALETEGGHTSLAPGNAEEREILDRLAARFGRVSNERAICGSGLVNLYEILCEIGGGRATFSEPEHITANAGSDPMCRRAVEVECELLGSVAGDIVLTFGAWDGVYLTGGLASVLARWIEAGGFRRRFENKGRLSPALARVPASIVMRGDVGLLGAASYALKQAGRFSADR